ncbi:40S ribosomal protein S8-B like [Verticillium longisporum]|uniref:40S ribosomal protein S8 n=1 Tax=Verticillium longisporum TaxID=100787 RepID=A0A8I3A016_VERLO|nr:40S ribosomal protein S8-B like [Verticillium longisporum]
MRFASHSTHNSRRNFPSRDSDFQFIPEKVRQPRPTTNTHSRLPTDHQNLQSWRAYYRKKRAFEAGRQEANTRIGAKRVHTVRTRGGNHKYRALRLDSGNFAWASEGTTRKTRVIGVAYHPSNNELVRTNTLTKSAVIQIDAAPFRQWYEAHYGQALGRRRQQKQAAAAGKPVEEEVKKSKSIEKKQAARFAAQGKVDPALEKQFEAGRLYAVIASRPGQSGRCDGYILEGEELAFYQRKLHK